MSDDQIEEVAGIKENGLIEGVRYSKTSEKKPFLSEEEEEEIEGDNVELILPTRDSRKTSEVYTVEDAINYMGFGPFQIIVTLFSGMIWVSDAMEVMLLSVLSPIVTCDWHLENWEEALITSIVFVGFFFGGLTWGIVADVIGRKKCLLIVDVIVLVFGLLSAISPSYPFLLLFRFFAGFGIGGSAQSVTYYVEFLPKKMRGICIVLLELWWAIGTIFAAVLALVVIPNIPDPINWRVYLGLCAIPLALVLFFFPFIPESARYYIIKGKYDKGEKVIKRIAWFNRTSPPPGRLVSQEEKDFLETCEDEQTTEANVDTDGHLTGHVTLEQEPLLFQDQIPPPDSSSPDDTVEIHVKDAWIDKISKKLHEALNDTGKSLLLLFKDKMWRTSVPLFFIWLGCAWLYYGAVLLTTTILETGYDPHCGTGNNTINDGCRNLTTEFYTKIVWTSAAEFPGIIITLIIIEFIGRKITMAVEFVGTGIFFGLLLICVPETYLTLFLFGARGFITGAFQTVYVYTPEVYPTRARGVSLGVMTSAARIGALLTPFIAQALFRVSDYSTIGLYVGSCILLTILSLILPIETKGKSLKDTHG